MQISSPVKTRRYVQTFILVLVMALQLIFVGQVFAQCCPEGYEVANLTCDFGACGECLCNSSSVPSRSQCIMCGNYDCVKSEEECIPNSCTCGSGCPSGLSTSMTSPLSGPLCLQWNNHSDCNDGCGNSWSCGRTACYRPETNLSDPTAPTSLTFNIGPIRHLLSVNENLRTLLAQPLPNETVTMSIPQYSYSGARDISYRIRANNQGNIFVNPDWQQFIESPLRDEDVSHIGAAYQNVPFNPRLGPVSVMYPDARGRIWANNQTLNECTNDTRTSPDLNGYYLVNTPPVVNSITKNFGVESIESGKAAGCASLNYTGREVQNPIGYRVVYSDINQNTYRDVEALYVWFAHSNTGGSPPEISGIDTS